MIITKTPFRVSLFGGSTDYASFYEEYGSLLIGFTLNKFCYLTCRETPPIFTHKSKVSYSKTELVSSNEDIKHNGVKGVLTYLGLKKGYEITHFSDLPAQTGIGSSSSFVVGLLNCLSGFKDPFNLAKDAINIERKVLNESGGIQDQIWAAYGGLNSIEIDQYGNFKVKPLPVCCDFKRQLIKRSVLIYTGKQRKSFEIAQSHDNKDKVDKKVKILNTARMAYREFMHENIEGIGDLLHDTWLYKKEISNKISNPDVDELYESLQKDGMLGGKLLGSGGSGFIYGILSKKANKYNISRKYKNQFIDFDISYGGSKIINE